MKNSTVVKIGVFSAIAFLLQMIHLPFKVGGFLEIEFSDIPAIIISFAVGPLAGVLVELIKNLLHLVVTSTGGVGEFANFLVNGAFVFTLGVIYKKNKTKKNAALALIAATGVLCVFAFFVNFYIMLPLYMKNADLLTKFRITAFTITPFNLVKGTVLSVITMLIYKRISGLIK
ncbi:MAG: ECF transporter S component [Firmicutes bacterium]|nr:ECF transporter S component [Bacillota bacterium]